MCICALDIDRFPRMWFDCQSSRLDHLNDFCRWQKLITLQRCHCYLHTFTIDDFPVTRLTSARFHQHIRDLPPRRIVVGMMAQDRLEALHPTVVMRTRVTGDVPGNRTQIAVAANPGEVWLHITPPLMTRHLLIGLQDCRYDKSHVGSQSHIADAYGIDSDRTRTTVAIWAAGCGAWC